MRCSGKRHGINAGLVAAAVMLMLAGCGGGAAMQTHRQQLSRLTYPDEAKTGQSLDIRVVREGSYVRLANATPRAYRNMQLWLNRRFVQRVDTIEIGSDNYYRLGRFVNRHGETFPLAGLLSPRRTEPVVLVELYDPGADVRHQLVVQPDKTEDE